MKPKLYRTENSAWGGGFQSNRKQMTYRFLIRRTHESPFEEIEIAATDSVEAVLLLPACISWNFTKGQDG